MKNTIIAVVMGGAFIGGVSAGVYYPINIIPTDLKLTGPFVHRMYGEAVATVVKIKDGDTFSVNIENYPPLTGYEIDVRLYGVDTAEMSDGGQEAMEFVAKRMPVGSEITLRRMKRGKYFRIVAEVILPDGQSLADLLLQKGLAYPYFGGTKRKGQEK